MRLTREKIVFVCIGAFALLIYLFVNTNSLGKSQRRESDRYQGAIRDLRSLDQALNGDVLKSRYGLLPHFDPLVHRLSRARLIRQELERMPAGLSAEDRDRLGAALAVYDRLQAEKEEAVERFKSESAVLGNSQRYFPVAVRKFLDEIEDLELDESLVDGVGALIELVSLYELRSEESLAPEFDELVCTLEVQAESLDPELSRDLGLLMDHGSKIFERTEVVAGLTEQVVVAPIPGSLDEIGRVHDRIHAAARARVETYQIFLRIYAVALVAAVAFILVRLERSAHALKLSNETLEDRVEQRTEELSRTNRELGHEVEERRRTEQELVRMRDAAQEATEAKSRFLASMSHELRTPLNAIIGYSELLKEDAEDTGQEDFVPDLDKIRSAGKHLLELINGILDLSKVEAGRMEFYVESFDVPELVRDVATIAEPLSQKNGNRFDVAMGEGVGELQSDLTKVRQILFNLISNACKFTEKGTVSLSAKAISRNGEGWLHFEVRDSGIGMTEEQISRIFQPFTQADSSTTRRFGGTGLGLAISREFSVRMGGSITVESEPEKGTVFHLQLPVVWPQGLAGTLAGRDEPAPPPVEGKKTVLVIDDDPAVHDIFRLYLKKTDFQIRCANRGEAGVKLAREILPDVILVDVVMPGLDGWDVLTALGEDPATAAIPLIVVTMTDEKSKAFSLGAAAFLTKPLDRESLHAALAECLEPGEEAAPPESV